MSNFIHFNGKIIPAEDPLVSAGNRGLRYGDGLFETMRVINGRIALHYLHFDRLFNGLSVLQFQCPTSFTPAYLAEAVLALCRKMNIEKGARVRLNVVRGNGGLFDPGNHIPNVIIEATPLETPLAIQEQGLVVDIYTPVRKHYDVLANIKSNNYLPYVLAALHARENRLDECLLLNTTGRVCDATIANVFWVKEDRIYTPPLSEGGVGGVMRRYLIENVPKQHAIREEPLTPEVLEQADEVFLTNAIMGIKWVGRYRDKEYSNQMATLLYNEYVKKLWE
jgi:branched-chain amino acid aminotransferase